MTILLAVLTVMMYVYYLTVCLLSSLAANSRNSAFYDASGSRRLLFSLGSCSCPYSLEQATQKAQTIFQSFPDPLSSSASPLPRSQRLLAACDTHLRGCLTTQRWFNRTDGRMRKNNAPSTNHVPLAQTRNFHV